MQNSLILAFCRAKGPLVQSKLTKAAMASTVIVLPMPTAAKV
jgi:hypothetical protein